MLNNLLIYFSTVVLSCAGSALGWYGIFSSSHDKDKIGTEVVFMMVISIGLSNLFVFIIIAMSGTIFCESISSLCAWGNSIYHEVISCYFGNWVSLHHFCSG